MRYVRCGQIVLVGREGHDSPDHFRMASVCYFPPTSAGFFHIETGKVVVHGESRSLDLKPAHDDAQVLTEFLGLGFARANVIAECRDKARAQFEGINEYRNGLTPGSDGAVRWTDRERGAAIVLDALQEVV
jgi:hypothetical protein